MLDIECFSYINRAIENEMSPILIIATNRGITKIRGTNELSPHGIPIDLLDRLLIIHTNNYSYNEIKSIINIRCDEEDVNININALNLLTKIAKETTLRYALNLIQPSYLLSKKRNDNNNEININDIKKVYSLFVDIKRSSKFLDEYQNQFLFHKKTNNNNKTNNDDNKSNNDIDVDIWDINNNNNNKSLKSKPLINIMDDNKDDDTIDID